MCPGDELHNVADPSSSSVSGTIPLQDQDSASYDAPPDWEGMELPPDWMLAHLTDAHCHPTDLDITEEEYNNVPLGALAAMGTIPEDQDRVQILGEARGWKAGKLRDREGEGRGTRVVACFGYHPWFVHRYTLREPTPTKEEHYLSIFFRPKSSPTSKHRLLLKTLLPFLPDPIPFQPLLSKLREDISSSLERGNLTMLGEVGLDGGARVRWPEAAKHLYDEKVEGREDEEEWKRLTPFKSSMEHQREILEGQLEIAIEVGVNVSFHTVAAPATLEALVAMRNKHGVRFTNRINVDLHSAGGWSPESWIQAEKQLLNLYASPSILITGRSATAPGLIRAISKDRMLVESDSHDARLTSRLVWGATEWIARCKGWKLEGQGQGQGQSQEQEQEVGNKDWKLELEEDQEEDLDIPENQVWTVRTLERNWLRFMGLVD